jgi:hypothetical protein
MWISSEKEAGTQQKADGEGFAVVQYFFQSNLGLWALNIGSLM